MTRYALVLLALAPFVQPNPAASYTAMERGVCNTLKWTQALSIQYAAKDTVPILLRHGFDEDGFGLDGVSLIVAIPKIYTPDCDLGVYETVGGLEMLGDGNLRGWITPQSRANEITENGQAIIFSPDAIIDWSYRPIGADQPTYGNSGAREGLLRLPVGETLSSTILPTDWD